MRQKQFRSKVFSVLSHITIVMALLPLVACSNSVGNNTNANGKNPANIHVGFVSATKSQNFALEMAAGAQYAANQYHVSAQIVAPVGIDGPAEVSLFQDLTRTALDGIAVETLTPDLFVQPEANAISKNIPVIAVDTTPLPGAKITTYIGNDNIAAGAMLASAAINLIPKNAIGSVAIGIDTPGVPVLTYRVQGMMQQFKSLRPDLQIIGPFTSFQQVQQNYNTWNDLIRAHSDIVANLGVGDPDNASLAQIKQNNHGTYLTGAFDLNEAGLQAVANGTNFALVDPEHFLKGYVAMRLLIEHALYGTTIPTGWWNTGASLIVQNNVQDIISRQVSLDAKGRFYQRIIDKEFADPAAQIKPLNQAT
jgi:ABC-type sugar transport system substrate-binding protein